ncbi:hypothetical protein D1007_59771 [Hordeum vulgare]|nr:hypothetical protein D1007_59771 [Hordeum vulgare]
MEVEAARCECCGFTEECTPEYITAVRAEYLGRWVCGLCAAAVGDEVRRAGVDGQRGGDEQRGGGEAGQDAAGPRLSLRDAAEGGGQAGEAGADQRGELVGRRLQVGDGRGGAAEEEQGGLEPAKGNAGGRLTHAQKPARCNEKQGARRCEPPGAKAHRGTACIAGHRTTRGGMNDRGTRQDQSGVVGRRRPEARSQVRLSQTGPARRDVRGGVQLSLCPGPGWLCSSDARWQNKASSERWMGVRLVRGWMDLSQSVAKNGTYVSTMEGSVDWSQIEIAPMNDEEIDVPISEENMCSVLGINDEPEHRKIVSEAAMKAYIADVDACVAGEARISCTKEEGEGRGRREM